VAEAGPEQEHKPAASARKHHARDIKVGDALMATGTLKSELSPS